MADARIAGWDLGGAHLKAALVSDHGRVERVLQMPCPLWQGLEYLERGIGEALAQVGPVERHAVTMTGELVDLFANRTEGVAALVDTCVSRLGDADIRFYAGLAGFLPAGQCRGRDREVASANWLASASHVARQLRSGLFLDLGSTTADIVPFAGGVVTVRGYSDAERLAEGELVYTGLTRTPVMAVTDRVPFRGRWYPLVAEHFATMADVHRLAGTLREETDQYPAADGRGKAPKDSARRLARMIGHDLEDAAIADWRLLARYLAECQRRHLLDACLGVLSRGDVAEDGPVVGAGIGRAVLRGLAERLDRPYADFAATVEGDDDAREAAADSAPAVAVALLLRAV